MSRLIDEGLKQLSSMLFHMGKIAYQAVDVSINNFIKSTDAYEEVQNLSSILTFIAEDIEDKVIELIARFQPVASDLRILKSYMEIAYDLTRYGRYALDISQIYKKLNGLKECEDWIRDFIIEMSKEVLKMIDISIKLLKDYDVQLIQTISEIEKNVDNMYFKYIDDLIEKVPVTTKCTISSILVVRYLERIADHATYICESIVYLATGQKVFLR